MNARIKELAEQAGILPSFQNPDVWICHDFELERFAELIRLDETKACAEHYLKIMRDAVEQAVLKEREANIKIIKRLRPEIVGTPNDPKTHQQWCESAALFSNFESIIAAIRQRGEK